MHVGTLRSLHRFPFKSMAGESLESAEVSLRGLPGDRVLAVRDDEAGEIRGGKHMPALMTCSARHEGDGVVVTLPSGEQLRAEAAQLPGKLSALLGRRVSVWPLEPAHNLDHYRRARPGSRVAGVLARSKTLRRGLQRALKVSRQDRDMRAMFGREEDESLPDLSTLPAEIFAFTSPPGTYFDVSPIHLLTTASLAAMAERRPDADWDVRRFRPNLLVETTADLTGLVEQAWAGRDLRIGEVVLSCTAPTPRCAMVMQAQPGVARDPSVLRSVVRDAGHNLGIYANVRAPGALRAGDPVELL